MRKNRWLVLGISGSSVLFFLNVLLAFRDSTVVEWGKRVVIREVAVFKDKGTVVEVGGTVLRSSGKYGAQYGRLLKLKTGEWLAAYTVSLTNGYQRDANGGLELEVAKSADEGRTWQSVGRIKDPGRDLDNAQMIQRKDGAILLACRSVRWQESYKLPVYFSDDQGGNWKLLSEIDRHEGGVGELGNPDQGVYEPHMVFLDDGRIAVMYANEKYAKLNPGYSQIISQKISDDNGSSWGKEIKVVYDDNHRSSRPGMPVWTRMKNGKFMVVYEICGPEKCNIYYKISEDGIQWPKGFGNQIPEQLGGPYLFSLNDGRLLVTSNKSNMSVSNDFGKTWQLINSAWDKTLWPSIYQINEKEVGVVNSVPREIGGNNIQVRFGKIMK
ncbi:sialidase family protein [Olivibacter domesticus]|uniref:BNR repeat-like domain-containing protein n=1 Tax=Olivibacter domesticus TaxID=407022 RepID=A0A1H7T4M9_OLID1|nr:sialidase family protein [Olivibacter domesticus]SEL79753.1 BNR repeat-like domain-containing protein [Olivibacter domesticus]